MHASAKSFQNTALIISFPRHTKTRDVTAANGRVNPVFDMKGFAWLNAAAIKVLIRSP
jgi:hypothetical protein